MITLVIGLFISSVCGTWTVYVFLDRKRERSRVENEQAHIALRDNVQTLAKQQTGTIPRDEFNKAIESLRAQIESETTLITNRFDLFHLEVPKMMIELYRGASEIRRNNNSA